MTLWQNRYTILGSALNSSRLFLSQEHLHRASQEVKITSKLVFKESSVRLADILRKIAEEDKLRSRCRQLHRILDADILTLG